MPTQDSTQYIYCLKNSEIHFPTEKNLLVSAWTLWLHTTLLDVSSVSVQIRSYGNNASQSTLFCSKLVAMNIILPLINQFDTILMTQLVISILFMWMSCGHSMPQGWQFWTFISPRSGIHNHGVLFLLFNLLIWPNLNCIAKLKTLLRCYWCQ